MDATQLRENWPKMIDKVQSRWHELSREEVAEIDGDLQKLSAKLRERYDLTEEEADFQMADFRNNAAQFLS